MGGQMRVTGKRTIGMDFNAAFTMAAALGFNATAVAEFLPLIERQAVSKINEHVRSMDDV
jgi:hypothetical protein